MADVINLAFQISADLKGVQSQLKTLEGNFQQSIGKIQSLARGVGNTLGIGFGVTAIVAAGKSILEFAGNLQDLEDQTGISAQLLSGMNTIFEETGTSAEAFAKGIFTAQRNLGMINSETDQAAIAVKQLGLNLNELRNASPQRFLELIAEALSKIDNPVQKAALGAQLLGRQFRELGPALSQAAGRIEELKRAGLSSEDIKLLDQYGDMWTKVSNKIYIAVSGAFADAIQTLETINRLIRINLTLTRSAAGAGALIGGAVDQPGSAGIGGVLKGSVKEKLQSPFIPPPDLAAQKKAVDAQKKAAEELKKIMEDAAKATADAIELTQKEWEDAGKGMIEVFKGLRVEALDPVAKELAAINARFDEWKISLIDAGNITGQSMAPFISQLEEIRKKALLAADPLEKIRKDWEAMREQQVGEMFSQDSAEFLTVPEDTAKEIARIKKESQSGFGFQDAEALIRGGAQGISDSLRSVAFGTQSVGEAFSNMGIAAVTAIQNVIFKMLILKPLLEGLKTSFEDAEDEGGGFIGAIGGFIGKLFGAGFAEGGIVPGPIGAPRLAKVHGGETIFPANKMAMAGGGVTNNYIDARGAERGVSQEIQRAIEMSREKAVRQSVHAVGEERSRSNAYARRFGR